MLQHAKWIGVQMDLSAACPVFRKNFNISGPVAKAELVITARGVYEARINGARVGEYVLAPGWTAYQKRLQVQTYDVTEMIQEQNAIDVILGKGWFRSPLAGWMDDDIKLAGTSREGGILAELIITYENGTEEIIPTDGTWVYGDSPILFSEIYDGETYDARPKNIEAFPVKVLEDIGKENLIPQEGPQIREMERVEAVCAFKTPKGETVIDFGQEVTGYVEFTVNAHAGDRIRILHGEVLDQDQNFYNANYRSAKAEINYICKNGDQTYHPRMTFFGFRYIKLDQWPGGVSPEQFTAIVVHSEMKQTGFINTGNAKINQLISNILWGQKGNFLDIPTDCPQRDERLGWTGDAEVFAKAATYNFDTEMFFRKWLHDLKAEQRPSGEVPQVIPDVLHNPCSAAWGDAATVIPWQVFMTFGDPQVLADQFESMKQWVDFITETTTTPGLWTGAEHCYGDWVGLDAPVGSYKGSTREEFIQGAYYYLSTTLVVKAGKVLGIDVSVYEELADTILRTFRKTYTEYTTQTEYVLAVYFGLAEDPQKVSDQLAAKVAADGMRLMTGFVGTPYMLHALSDYGHADIAYNLLLREEYPSWLYPISKGATTIWEHWDGIMTDGSFWSTDMNSFNHYAYGSVIDWLYEKAGGIQPIAPGFEQVLIAPNPDRRLGFIDVTMKTRQGEIRSKWTYVGDRVRYEIDTPVVSVILVEGQARVVRPGHYTYWG